MKNVKKMNLSTLKVNSFVTKEEETKRLQGGAWGNSINICIYPSDTFC